MTSEPASLHIPFAYSGFQKPEPAHEGQQILFEAVPEKFWRVNDTIKFESSALIIDCLPSIRRACQDINNFYNATKGKRSSDSSFDEPNGIVRAIIHDSHVDEGRFVVGVYTDNSALLNEQRAKIIGAYCPIKYHYISIDLLPSIKEELLSELAKIADCYNVAVYVTDFLPGLGKVNAELPPQDKGNYGGIDENNAQRGSSERKNILVYGDAYSCSYAYLMVKVLVEQLVYENYVDTFTLEFSLQSLITGVRGGNIATIMDQSGCRLYFHDQLPDLYCTYQSDEKHETEKSRNLNEVYIVGPSMAHVELAKGMLKDVIERTTPLLFQDCVVSFAKIDCMILLYQDEIKDIMYKYGSFIQLPFLGASRSLVRVMGVNSWSLESSIDALMKLTCDFYDFSFMFHTGQRDTEDDSRLERPILDIQIPAPQSKRPIPKTKPNYLPQLYTFDEIFSRYEKIAHSTGAVLTNLGYTGYEIFGYKSEAKKATTILRGLANLKDYHQQIVCKLEIGSIHKDFIAGKKGGKLHRIMKNANVWIRFLPFNGHNIYISVEADSFTSATTGLQLLEDELPAELSFYVPSLFHRQLIGTGGQNIQNLMRNYNVFIKFINDHDEYPNAYSLQEADNVLIRCPTKNARSIPECQHELLQSVAHYASALCNTFVYMTRSHRRILVTHSAIQLKEVERKTGCIILLPSDIINGPDGMVEVQALGNASQVSARIIRTLLPDEYEFKIAHSRNFTSAIDSSGEFYEEIVVPLRLAFHIEVQAYLDARSASQGNYANTTPQSKVAGMTNATATSHTATPPRMPRQYHRIVLSYLAEDVTGLDDAVQFVTAFLRRHDLSIIDRGEVKYDPIEEGTAAVVGVQRKKEFIHGLDTHDSHSSSMPSASRALIPDETQYRNQGYYPYDRGY